jgi:hypothetical protein
LPQTLPPMRRIVRGRVVIQQGKNLNSVHTLVTPAKAGGHHLTGKFKGLVMDSRLRGNDEVLAGEVFA